MRHKTGILPVRVHSYNGELEVHVTRIVAYRGVCSCAWRGPSRARFQSARMDVRGHRAETRA